MRLLALRLLAFGPFSGTTLDFSAKPSALHVVYGPNEAGKSTSLRALDGLFFGIPERTTDDHRHAMPELRVGALLEGANGTVLEVVRRKGRKDTLRGPDDAPIDEARLVRLLGGADRELFASLHALDHESLRTGATELLAGKGRIGRALFEAGAGGLGVSRLLEGLASEAEAIWAPRKHKAELPTVLKQLEAARREVEKAGISPESYEQQLAGIREAEEEAARAEARVREAEAQLVALSRVRATLPLVRERASNEAVRASLGVVPPGTLDRAEERQRAQRDVTEGEPRLATILSEEAVARGALGSHGDAGIGVEVSADDEERLQRLVGRHSGDEGRVRQLTDVLERRAAEERAAALAATDEDVEVGPRLAVLELAIRAGERALERRGERAEATRAARVAADRLVLARAELGLPPGVTDLTTLDVPSREEVEREAAAEREAQRASDKLADRAATLERELGELRAERASIEAAGPVPDEARLAAARAARDEVIASRGGAGGGESVALLREAVAAADEVADRRFREAARVERLAALDARQADLVARREASGVEAGLLAGARAARRLAWAARWERAGLVSVEAERAGSWLDRRNIGISAMLEARAHEEREAGLAADEARAEQGLTEALGVSAPLDMLVARAGAERDRLGGVLRRAEAAREALRRARAQRDAGEAELAGARAERDAVGIELGARLAELGLAGTPPAEALTRLSAARRHADAARRVAEAAARAAEGRARLDAARPARRGARHAALHRGPPRGRRRGAARPRGACTESALPRRGTCPDRRPARGDRGVRSPAGGVGHP